MFDLTSPQQNIWNLQRFYEGTGISNICGSIFLEKKCDHILLNQAINKLIEEQDGMRLRFCEKEGKSVQYIYEYEAEQFVSKAFESRDEFEKYANEYAKEPFQLMDSQMYRFVIFDLEDQSGILLCANHLICDAWAISIIADTICEKYDELESGIYSEKKNYSYQSFIGSEHKYLQSVRYEKDREYWEKEYLEKPELCPIKPNCTKVLSPTANRYTTQISGEFSRAIDRFYEDYHISQAVLFETAIAVYLSKVNEEQKRISWGIPVLNRLNAAEKKAVGMNISTIPLTVSVSEEETAEVLCEKITEKHFQVFRHQRFPYSHILRNIHNQHDFSGNVYDVIVSFQNAKIAAKANTKWFSNGFCEVGMEFHVDNRDHAEMYTLNVDYQTELFFSETEVELLVKRILYVMEQIIENPKIQVREISILPIKEYQKVISEFNDTAVDYPKDKCVHELFQEQVQKNPEKAAVVFEGEKYTYRQIDEMSNALAHLLFEKGIRRGDIVPIIAKRSYLILVAMFGALKAGAAYMPVDPTYPEDRIEYMLEEANVKLAFTLGYEKSLGIETVDLEKIDFEGDISQIENQNEPEDLCYIIYTSGSTGRPKGVVIPHSRVVNYSHNNNNNNVVHSIIKSEYRSIVSVTNIVFDIFVTESILPLLNGLTIYFANENQCYKQKELALLITENKVDVIQTTPTKMRSYLLDKKDIGYLKTLKAIVLGGEAFPEDLYKEISGHTDAEIFNIYGPAETTVWSTNAKVTGTDITIGRPIANTQIYILDKQQNPVPIGVAGELCISGDGVGKGYLNRPDLTAERFIPNPFIKGTMMYRTGDLARWRVDGEIEYLGRIDTQVKIRGLRIELGEIESVMAGFPGIQLVAVADKKDETGRQYLVGYYTSESQIDEKELRQLLTGKLPKYMVPNYFMRLDKMPMTASGKTDRKSLPIPECTEVERNYVEPKTITEQRIVQMWEELLLTAQIGREDDFFETGGDSLSAIYLSAKLESEFHVAVTAKDILEHSVLKELAAYVDQAEKTEEAITQTGEKEYELLPQQMAIYAVCSKEPDTLTYNMPTKMNLPEDIDKKKLKQCLRQLSKLHPEMKTRIHMVNNVPRAYIEESAELIVEEILNEEEFVRPFDLQRDLLVRIAFMKEVLLFDMHHIIADGISLSKIIQDLAMLYSGKQIHAPSITYVDYAKYFYQKDFEEHKNYFHKMLKCDFEPLALPESSYKKQERGASRFYQIDCKMFEKGRKIAKKYKLTDTMLYFGIFGILLSKYTGISEMLTGIVMTNRVHKETQDVVGMFVNTLPVMLPTKGKTIEYLEYVKELIMNLFQYQEIPFFTIADAVGMHDKNAVNTSFVYQAEGERMLMLDDTMINMEWMDTHTSKFDLSFELTPNAQGCAVRIEYNCGKYDSELIDKMFESYLCIIDQMEKESVEDISVLSTEEYQKVIFEFNDTAVDYPKDKCVHELFQEQVKKTPEQTAAVFEGKEFTYRQIDEMSNALAHLLQDKEIGRGDIVPIIAKRSHLIIVAMLGILKAGAAYMLIDSTYPSDRINYMINEMDAKIVFLDGAKCTLCNTLAIDLQAVTWNDGRPIKTDICSDDIYCVIHTSGTTGEPKLSCLSHRNIVNYIETYLTIASDTKCSVAFTIITFDAFILDTIIPMICGKKVIIASEDQIYHQEEFEKVLLDYENMIAFFTPTKLKNYLQLLNNKLCFSKVSKIVLGGEVFEKALADIIFRICPNTSIFNIYGPTETTINSSYQRVKTNTDITIGRPIANTQIYILDKQQTPVPIGVAGELYISGDGVGKGYLNRPDLTAERFIPNPFIKGTMMYRTGDLARWRVDGEIEYLGRIDTQVKIRGLRIELGEIESVMAGFPGIQLVAVADKKDETGRQYLVGYYTSESQIDEKELRQLLTGKLPKYMVPNYFMRLDKMPMTASGKTDRKNLPIPEFAAVEREYIAPETAQEQVLCNVLAELFQAEQVSVEDDFFEIGGDSLRAIEYVAKAHNEGISFALQNVFDYPSVRQLCEYLNSNERVKVEYFPEDFVKYQPLLEQNIIDEKFIPVRKSLGNMFLTGATGFLGSHVLERFMKEESGKIYCLVRGGEKRLADTLEYYFGDTFADQLGHRIIAVEGDITRQDLADVLPDDVQTVVHTAATVKHYGSYNYFYGVNVLGTKHVIAYTKRVGAELLHISTLSVSGNSLVDAFDIYYAEETMEFAENSLYIGQPLDNVYIHSKFEAERAVLDAMLEGLDAKIIRVGNLTNRASDYKFQPNYQSNAFLTRVKAALELGRLPDYLLSLYAEFSPIDQTAEGIVKIAQYADRQTVFHLNSNRGLYFDRMIKMLHTLGISMDVVEGNEFNRILQQLAKDSGTEYIYEAFQNDMDQDGKLVYDSNIHILNDFTVWFLEKLGFQWIEIDQIYMNGYIEYFRKLDYLEV